MAIIERSVNHHPPPNHQREPDPVQEPPAREEANRPSIQIGVCAVAIMIVLLIVCGGCIFMYKDLKDKEIQYKHEEEMCRIERAGENAMEIARLQMLEEKKIEATRDVYMKSFEAKKVVNKHSYLFGLISREKEEVESPLKDGHMLHIVQEALRPQLTQGNRRNNSGRIGVIDEDM